MLNTQQPEPSINRYIIYCRKSSESDERQVQSLSDQINMLLPFIQQRGLHIAREPLQESKSAKAPGRPVFDEMVQLVEQGIANGIILLNPSRLSRNTVDTGRIIYLMDQGKLEEVVTPYQAFKNNPYDKFMLNLLCTQAKLENDNKSVTVKDSMRLKAERGDFPGKARPGYMNNHEKNQGQRDISPHPIYFPLMRKLIDLALTGRYSVEALTREAENMGVRNYNGKIIWKSSMHCHLRDPFYTGKFIYKGKLYKGNHAPLMTEEEFSLLQDILNGKSRGRMQKHDFPLNEIISCGECHYRVTAEEHTRTYKNGKTHTFAYYRCTKKAKTKCNQPYISTDELEKQVIEELQQLELEPEFATWAFEALDEMKDTERDVNKGSSEALQKALEGVNKRINNLLALKISADNSDGSLLSDGEFSERRKLLLQEKEKITMQLNQTNPINTEWVQVARDSFDFALLACNRFRYGVSDDKKTIARTIGSDMILLYQHLQFQPRFLFLKYKEGIKKTRDEIHRLEPNNTLSDQAELSYFLKNAVWSPQPDSNRRSTR